MKTKCFNCGKRAHKDSMVKLHNIALGYIYYCERCSKVNVFMGSTTKYSAYRPGKQNPIKNKSSKKMKGVA